MQLTDYQSAWAAYDQKINRQQVLTEKMMLSMIKDRSRTTLATMSRKNLRLSCLFLFYTLFFISCITGNAFDYEHPVWYIPMTLQAISCMVMAVLLLNHYNRLKQVNPAQGNLAEVLQQVIRINERHHRLSGRIWWGYFIPAVLFPFTFLPRTMAHRETLEAVGLTAIPVAIIIALLVAAKKWQWFKDNEEEQLKDNLQELKANLAELQANPA